MSPNNTFHFEQVIDDSISEINREDCALVHFESMGHAKVQARFECFMNDVVRIWAVDSIHELYGFPNAVEDIYTLHFVVEGTITRIGNDGVSNTARRGNALFVPFHEMKGEIISRNFRAVGLTISEYTLRSSWAALTGDPLLHIPRFVPVADMSRLELHALQETVKTLYKRLKGKAHRSDLVLPLIEEMLTYQILSSWPSQDQRVSHSSQHTTTRQIGIAINFIEENITRKISVADIASAADLNVRSLQSLFKAETGYTPIEFVLNCRLDRVHSALRTKKANETVRDIAMRWGFVHMSDFSRRYLSRFGETPLASSIE